MDEISLSSDVVMSHVIRYKDISLNTDTLDMEIRDYDIKDSLTLTESRLLKLFLYNPNKCLTQEYIVSKIWSNVKISSRTLSSNISRLRKRLKPANVNVESVYAQGYILRY